MVVTSNAAMRRGFETALVSELNEHGLEGVAAYTAVPEDAAQDSEKARPYIQKTGASYPLVLQVTGTDQQITGTPSMTTAGMWHGPRQFWGPTWGGWGWAGGTDIRTDTIVRVHSLLYDLDADELVWAGQSETMNPGRVREVGFWVATYERRGRCRERKVDIDFCCCPSYRHWPSGW
jgi:hypothetical protein